MPLGILLNIHSFLCNSRPNPQTYYCLFIMIVFSTSDRGIEHELPNPYATGSNRAKTDSHLLAVYAVGASK